jgi:small subunit ribosomal protein S20
VILAGKVRVSIFENRFRKFRRQDVPNIASAKKNMRKTRAATVRNRAQRSALRTALKRAKAPNASAEERTNAVSLLDRAARKGLIHANAAARHKSRMAIAANA